MVGQILTICFITVMYRGCSTYGTYGFIDSLAFCVYILIGSEKGRGRSMEDDSDASSVTRAWRVWKSVEWWPRFGGLQSAHICVYWYNTWPSWKGWLHNNTCSGSICLIFLQTTMFLLQCYCCSKHWGNALVNRYNLYADWVFRVVLCAWLVSAIIH